MVRKLSKAFLVALVLSSGSAFAADVSGNFETTATIEKGCVLLQPGVMNFGVVSGIGRVMSSFDLSVICTSGTAYTLTGEMPIKTNTLSLDKKYYHTYAFKMYKNGVKDDNNFMVFTPYLDALANDRNSYFGNGGLSDLGYQTYTIQSVGSGAVKSHKVDIELASYDAANPMFRPMPAAGFYSANYTVGINY